jgi:hypothetical protein
MSGFVRGVRVTKSIASVCTLAIFLVLQVGPTAYATPGGSSDLTTSPISSDLSIKPGDSKTTTLQVRNNGPQPVAIAIQLKQFKSNGTQGQATIIDPPAGDDSLSWVHFSQQTFTALPGVFTPIDMTIVVPKTASLGYYYAVLFKPVLSGAAQTNTNTVTLSNAILVLVDTSTPNEIRRLDIVHFTASRTVYEYLPASFELTVHNGGNIYLPPRGVINISRTNDFTKPLVSLDINRGGGRVLPNSSRTFGMTWNDGFPRYEPKQVGGQPLLDKSNRPIQSLQVHFADSNKFRFGKYHAQVALVYNNGLRDIPVYAEVSFWVIPWKIIVIALVALALQVLIIVMALRYRRLYRKSKRINHAAE